MEENVFERMAEKYDSPDRIALANIVANRVKEELRDAEDKTLIDYGSGTGLVGLQLAELVKSATLIDSSENMVKIIREKITNHPITNAETLVADFTTDTLDLKADIIVVSLVLLHIPDTKAILKSLYETLNKGGRLIIIDFEKNPNVSHPKVHNGFDFETLTALLTDTGFESTDIQVFHHGKQVFMKQDASLFIAVSEK
ncbi:class I SAM-dependent methyltransferase [Listeria booriae]|uniref:class I SAM-dependent methyltransferase n=1 Tax=Listeria booriae TaxID=1552123 RepID=UPI00162AC324|nr:methyltransferase domain-containing protein [Listeria booriae]MBC2328115.1 class I SAM-dependent methyltransferase [Listeria booriae]